MSYAAVVPGETSNKRHRLFSCWVRHYWHDQAALLHLLGYDAILGFGSDWPDAPDRQQVARLDPAWNAIPAVATVSDPIIHHWAGVSGAKRERAIAADVAMLPFRDAHVLVHG